jgi:predicted transcriptional regulator
MEAILRHEGRLDVLCCLIDGESLAIPQLSARTGRSLKAVSHYVKLLESFDLIERVEGSGGDVLYAATLDTHPDWVRETVDEHRRAGY